jgi:hypothetical protein
LRGDIVQDRYTEKGKKKRATKILEHHPSDGILSFTVDREWDSKTLTEALQGRMPRREVPA